MRAGEAMAAVGRAPTVDGRSERAALLARSRDQIAGLMSRQRARGVALDTMAYCVLDLRDEFALALALRVWLRLWGPSPPLLAAGHGLTVVLCDTPVHILADLASEAGPVYAEEAAAALRGDVLPEHVHVLVIAAGGAAVGVGGYRIEQPVEA